MLVESATATIDDARVDVTVPSEKVKLVGEKFDIVSGGHVQMVVTFDAHQSLVVDEEGSYHLKPLLRYELH